MNSFDLWLMDSECCSECGAILDHGEFDLCADCRENAAYDEEQAQYAAWYNEEDTMNEDIPKPKDRPITVRIEWKPNDLWIGVYWRKTYLLPWKYRRRWQRDIWICILPMLPIHIWWTRTENEDSSLGAT